MKDIEPYYKSDQTVASGSKVHYPVGKNQRAVLDGLASFDTYYKGCGWVYLYHSDTVEVLEALKRRGFVDMKPQLQPQSEVNESDYKFIDTWGLTFEGAHYVNGLRLEEDK